ncbi:hypothetical protein K438DRAFT_2059264 [Mycena galopus ATCC 62051]|nr:hypothetical protein K438DRAFT_2059264 [Mycena galopus ATCC 62051]
MDVDGIPNPAPPYAREDPFPTPQGPPPAYEHPPAYEAIFGPAEQLGDPMQMTESSIIIISSRRKWGRGLSAASARRMRAPRRGSAANSAARTEPISTLFESPRTSVSAYLTPTLWRSFQRSGAAVQVYRPPFLQIVPQFSPRAPLFGTRLEPTREGGGRFVRRARVGFIPLPSIAYLLSPASHFPYGLPVSRRSRWVEAELEGRGQLQTALHICPRLFPLIRVRLPRRVMCHFSPATWDGLGWVRRRFVSFRFGAAFYLEAEVR